MKDIFLAVIKIFLFLLILPLIAASCIAFQNQILGLPAHKEAWLLWGVGFYALTNFFVYDFKEVYAFGHALVGKIFSFFQPLVEIAGYVVPIYSVLLIIVYLLTLIFGRAAGVEGYFFFAIAFTLGMHVVLAARELYGMDNSPLKAHYLLTFGFIFVINLFFMSLLLAWVIPEYSFVGYVKSLASNTSHLYKSIYKLFFVDF